MNTIPGSAPASSTASGSAPADVGGPINILIVDDEQKNLTVLETVLDDPDYRLVRADTADKALLALIAEEFALIILDINMPGMSGFELAQMIRERRKTARVPIIFLTAYYNEDQHILEGYAAGAVDFLHKPVNRTILRSKVATFAELHRSARVLQLEIVERRHAQEQLRAMNETLEQRVVEKTEALRATDAQLQMMIDALPAAIYATDADGYLTHFNPATVELSGRMPQPGVDRWCTTWKLFNADGTSLAHDECPMAVAVTEGRIIRGQQIIAERPNGERTWVTPYPTPLRNPAGEIVGGINMLVDITDAKRAEDELSAAKRAAEEANAAKSDFLAHMSHEIRTPMNAIFGFTQLLSESIQAPLERDWIASIKKSGELLLSVINDVLDLSKIEAGKLDLHLQPTNIVDILDDMIAMFTPQAAAKGIALVRDIDADGETFLLDGQRVRQVLMNLVSNAVKFTETGSVTVRLEISEGKAADLRDIAMIVEDTGVGIPAAEMSGIFEPFCQAESPDGKIRQGTGLGLTISRRLVSAMSGTIEVGSVLGEGTTFTIRIPDLAITDLLPAHSAAGEDVDFNALPPLDILIVDDVTWNLEVAAGYLRNSHHTIHLANNGLEGLASAQAHRPDVVLMDLRMPVMDGYQARDAMRSDPSLARTAIIAVTASSLSREEGALRDGFDECVRKPYSPRQLFGALARSVGRAAQAHPPQTADEGAPEVWGPDLRAHWQEMQQVQLPALAGSMRMRELAEFAQGLGAFADDARYADLQTLASALKSSIDGFDVRRVSELLQRIARLAADFEDS